MHYSTLIPAVLSVAAAAAAIPAAAAPASVNGRTLSSGHFAWHETASVFHDSHAQAVKAANERLARPVMRVDAGPNGYQPASSMNGLDNFGDIDGPGGELWYYSAAAVCDTIPPHGDVPYTDIILREYEYTIYDPQMNVVGTVRDKVDYAEDEVRVVRYDLSPIITTKFFNTDDRYEIIISLTVNTDHYANNSRTFVYSIGGEKDAEGFDVPVWSTTDFLADVIEGAPLADGTSNYFMTFSHEENHASDDAGFWEYLTATEVVYEIYSSATDGSDGPVAVTTQRIPMIQVQGDQQDSVPMFSMSVKGHTYYVMPMYDEPFYNQYDNPLSDDMTQREPNTLHVRIFEATPTSFEQIWSVPVPVSKTADESIVASYFSVGSLNYDGDIVFDENLVPTIVVTKWDYTPVQDDAYIKSYYVYDSTGTRKAVLAEQCDAALNLPDVPGQTDQMMFVRTDEFGDTFFDITNLSDGKVTLSIPQQFEYSDDAEIEPLTASVTRVADGDSHLYCFELRVPEYDDATGEDVMRFMWLDAKGKFVRIDRVAMGRQVQYAQSYLGSPDAVKPGAYTTKGIAYMMLIKRGTQGSESREELYIATPSTDDAQGEVLLNLLPDERGNLTNITPSFKPEGEQSVLNVYYYHPTTKRLSLDTYYLPLESNSGVDAVVPAGSAITLEGGILRAEGPVAVYNAAGAIVARGNGSLSTAYLAPGLYIAVAGNQSLKLVVR